jgi:RimJ/RimL family protein N-acetyltransferase
MSDPSTMEVSDGSLRDSHVRFEEIGESDAEHLVDWLPKQTWPYHARTRVDEQWVRHAAAAGVFFGPDTRSFWVMNAQDIRLAIVRVFDLSDITPLVDLRVAYQARGHGLGTEALRWLTQFVFETYPQIQRLGGYTRQDNVSMHRVFKKCGYVQEAWHRKSWRVEGGSLVDSAGFAILRTDWASGTTTPLHWSPG